MKEELLENNVDLLTSLELIEDPADVRVVLASVIGLTNID